MHDIIVIGGGPAGLTAAVYGLRNGKSVLVIEKNVFGGQIVNSPNVENIPGFDSISGDEFGDRFLEQAMGQGADVTLEEVIEVRQVTDSVPPRFVVETAEGSTYEGYAVILATGTTHRLLGLPGEEELIGNGISFCAVCDGDFYKDKKVVMIGGGNSAFVEAALLVEIVDELVMLQDMPYFTADQKARSSSLHTTTSRRIPPQRSSAMSSRTGKWLVSNTRSAAKRRSRSATASFWRLGLCLTTVRLPMSLRQMRRGISQQMSDA